MPDEFARRVSQLSADLPPAAARVASFIAGNRATVLACSAAEIAGRAGTSNATVIRAVQALGYEGLPALKRAVASSFEEGDGAGRNMQATLADLGGDSDGAVDAVLDAHRDALDALTSAEGRAGIREAVVTLKDAARIAIFGIGPSAHLARYMAFQLSRLGRESLVLDATGWTLADQLLTLRHGDAVVALAYGQPYREIRALCAEVRRLGAKLVLVSDVADGSLADQATLVLRAHRGRADRVALHAATLAALEAIILGLAALDEARTTARLADLTRLRQLVGR